MDLQSFIKRALTEVISGVKEAQKATDPGTIVPRIHNTEANRKLGILPVQTIEFDISVTVDESSGAEGRIGVFNGIFGAGASGKSEKTEGAASVIRFKVPIEFPESKIQSDYDSIP